LSLGSIGHTEKFTFIILALSLLLTACNRRDSKLDQQIAGTWTREGSGTLTFAPDGSFLIVVVKPDHTNSFAGTWQTKHRVLIMTLTNAPVINVRSLIGGVEQYNIIAVNDHEFLYEESGQTNTLSR
jgi:hypothetical protein